MARRRIPGERRDQLWQDERTVRGYERTRSSVPYEREEFDIVCRVLAAHGVEPLTMLDLGAGDGLATAAMMERMPVHHAVLVDFSVPMLAAARGRFAESANGAKVDIVEGDLFDPGWPEALPPWGPYDLVLSRHAIHHLPHERKRRLNAEILELLRPGGMFVNIEHVQSLGPQYAEAFDQLMVERIHSSSANGSSLDDVVAQYRARMDGDLNILAPVEDQLGWLRESGFVDVDCAFKALELAVLCGRRPAG